MFVSVKKKSRNSISNVKQYYNISSPTVTKDKREIFQVRASKSSSQPPCSADLNDLEVFHLGKLALLKKSR